MAHVAKVKSSGVAPMVGHYAREAEARGYERDNIDPTRTRLNYEIRPDSPDPLASQVRTRVRDAMAAHERAAGRAVRKDANVMLDWVVTLPKDCPPERADEFFTATVDFIRNRYGAKNVPGGFVHRDETTPHVHVPVVPVRDGKLQASKVVNRADLKTFHKALGAAVDAALGFHVSIELDEAQKGAKQLSALSQDEYRAAKDELLTAKAELEVVEWQLDERKAALTGLTQKCDEVESQLADLQPRLERLQGLQREEVARAGALERACEFAAGLVDALLDELRNAGKALRGMLGLGVAGAGVAGYAAVTDERVMRERSRGIEDEWAYGVEREDGSIVLGEYVEDEYEVGGEEWQL